ncbi:transcriptional regulator ATRX [Tripterygium wilfordii]|uniref:Transcriptional regulator ATRX n=1 Tax=Tripterygium wilfordii TaxID=458696 RepID=A0A7J7CVZ6_TRIWF|nr:protein PXR1-like [Tripterygium wilfordii]KAF5738277.1 transcriptional regulator ATRX [Tripterygium wilfordii]
MKIVKAKVISSTPIRLSKAASILSKFASSETGASQALGAYLRRASYAFNELTQLSKVLKSSSWRSHRKNHSGYETEATVGGEENATRAPEPIQEPSQPEPESQEPSRTGEERKGHKKKNEEKGEFVNSFNEDVKLEEAREEEPSSVRNAVDGNIEAEGGKKKHKKRRKERGDDVDNSEENGFQNEKVETVVKFETNEVEEKERKKRKSVEVEEEGEIGFEEQRSKIKKRKSGDGDN